MTAPRGFSLMEVVTAVGVAALIWGLVVRLLLPLFHGVARYQQRARLSQAGSLALQQMRHELQRCPSTGVSFSHQVLSLQAIDPRLPNGEARMLDEIRVFRWTASTRQLRVLRYARPAGPRLSAGELAALAQATPLEERLLARDVEEFVLSSPAEPNLGMPLKIRLVLKSGLDQFTGEQTIYLRNTP